jgi:hypothetical protein
LEVVWNGNVWVSPATQLQTASQWEAARDVVESFCRDCGDDPEECADEIDEILLAIKW